MNSIVYCEHCKKEFADYRRVGQHIRDQLIVGMSQQAGTVPVETFLGNMISKPTGGVKVVVGKHEIEVGFTKVQRAFYGSRRDACNAAQVPCPSCGRFSRWKRGVKNGRGVITASR